MRVSMRDISTNKRTKTNVLVNKNSVDKETFLETINEFKEFKFDRETKINFKFYTNINVSETAEIFENVIKEYRRNTNPLI